MTSSQLAREARDEHRQRAGALMLQRVAKPQGPQPSLPAEETAFVAEQLGRWLAECPYDPLSPGPEAEGALAALLDGWCSTVVHALAARPLSVAEVAAAEGTPDEGTAAEQIAAMESVGLLSSAPGGDGELRFEATAWLRHAIAPLAAAARLELQLPQGETAPIVPLDVEAAFLLTLPLVALPEELYGTCRLTVPVPGSPPRLAGVVVRVEDGEFAAISTDLSYDSNNFASAGPRAWIDTLIDPSVAAVDFSGDPQFTLGLLGGLHEALFGTPVA